MSYDSRDYYRPAGFGGFSFFPPVIKQLLIINGIVFFIQFLAKSIAVEGGIITLEHYITKYFGLIPLFDGRVFIDGYRYIPASFWPWQLVTYQFLHGDLSHIFFNMFMLWMFGMELENLWGSKKFLIYYLSCGIGGAVLQLLLQAGSVATIGASGSVFGVMVAFAMFFPDRYIFLYFLVPIKAKYLIAFLVLIEVFSVGELSIIAHLVHIGGALTGLVMILIDRKQQINIEQIWRNLKKRYANPAKSRDTFRRPARSGWKSNDVQEADFYDINQNKTNVNQSEIDRILDKISQSGYQNLTAEEKKILFEASKKN